MPSFRYHRWDGSQNPLTDDLTVEELLDASSDDLLAGEGVEAALHRIMRQGISGRFGGLQSLLDRLREARRRQLEQGRADAILEEIRAELDRILDLERAALAARDDAEARTREGFLDSLPNGPAGQITELRRYEFVSTAAKREFDALLDRLRRETLGAYVRGLAQGMRDLSDEQRRRMKEMLGDLNRMLEQRRAGTGPTQDEFDEFMRRHGEFFPEGPRTIDELIEALGRRQVALSRLLASLAPDQRAELEALARGMLEDLDLAFEVDRLSQSLRDLIPDMPWDRAATLDGEQPLGLEQSLEAIERLADFEDLERSLRGEHPGATLEDVDVERLRRTLGEDAVDDLERIRRIERALTDAGIVTRRGGKLEMTPRGIRRLGDRALSKVFERLTADRPGTHDTHTTGGMAEPTGATRPWRFGDEFRIDVHRTLHNAVLREGPGPGRIRLRAEDFEAVEAEARTAAATVLLLDMSFSMPMRGNWIPAKRMALALHSLIGSRYPEDHLEIVGFSDYARVLAPEDLVRAGWEHVYGTNMQHAFNLAGRLLAKRPAAAKQVILVTDGEPTAHLVGERVFFRWPPVRETIEKTFREAMRLARAGVTMNIFMLEDSPALFNFVDRLARVVAGRVFAVRGDELGEFAVRDYLVRRSSRA